MSKLNIIHFETLPSTNTYAKENAEKLLLPALIIADGQTNGRGRRGKSFFSPSGTGLYMTLVFKAPDNCELITCAAAVSVCRELEALGAKPEIKWVNDVFSDGHKVCGILTELFGKDDQLFVAVGIGINLTTVSFPEELSAAGSLNIDCEKSELAEKTAERLLGYIKNSNDGNIIRDYKKRLFVLGRQITYTKNGEEFSAKAIDINDSCNLIVERSDGIIDTLSSGEISIKL